MDTKVVQNDKLTIPLFHGMSSLII